MRDFVKMKLLIILSVFLVLTFAEEKAQWDIDLEYDGDEDFTPFEAAVALYEENGYIVGECRDIHRDCIKLARTTGQKIKCFIQLGLCVGSKVSKCSGKCVRPLIMCRLNSGKSWPATFKCATQFIQCVIAGCTEMGLELEWKDKDYTPYEAATGLLESNGGIVEECRQMHQDCLDAATSVGQKIRCFVQLGLCLGVRVAGCSKQCVMPLVTCKMAAGDSWPAVFKCATDFIQCAIGGCKGAGYEVDNNNGDYTPYEAATALMEVNGDIVSECRQMHQDCLDAATSVGQKIRCFIQLGLCLGVRVAGCSKQCVMPLVTCKMAAGDSWPAIFKCATDFIQCAASGCKETIYEVDDQNDDYTPYEAATALMEMNGDIITECRQMHQDCLDAATSVGQKIRCFVQLGLCLGVRVAGCSKQCVMPLVTCKMAAGDSWPAIFKCATDFIQCAASGCKETIYEEEDKNDYSPYEAATGLLEVNGGIVEECRQMHQDCLEAATSAGQKIRCFVQLGLCLGVRVAGCSKQCVMPLVTCKMAAGDSWPAVFKCATDFIQCAVSGCKETDAFSCKGDECFSADDVAVEIFLAGTPQLEGSIIDQCKMMHEECVAAASSIIQKSQCFIQLGLCLGSKAVGCAKECIPPLIKCKVDNIGSAQGLIQCSADFLKCVVGGCSGSGEFLTEEKYALLPNDVDVVKQCFDLEKECMKKDPRHPIGCYLTSFLCMVGRILTCGKVCIKPYSKCLKKAGKDPKKLKECKDFVFSCTREQCKKSNELEEPLDEGTYTLPSNDVTGDVKKCLVLRAECKKTQDKGTCDVNFFFCIAARLFSCGKDCIRPFIQCEKEAFGDPKKGKECKSNLIACLKEHCKKNDAMVPDNDSKIDQCKVLHESCMKAAKIESQKMQCTILLGICEGIKAVGCAKQCVLPLIMCRLNARGSPEALEKCSKEFFSCTAKGCPTGSGEIFNEEKYALLPNDGIDVVKQCFDLETECLKREGRTKCKLNFLLCMVGRIFTCGNVCLMPYLQCGQEEGTDPKKRKECKDALFSCVREHCKKSNAVEIEPNESLDTETFGLLPNDGTDVVQQCFDQKTECEKMGRDKNRCKIVFFICIVSKLFTCGKKDCYPPFTKCGKEAGKDPKKREECRKAVYKCLNEHCKSQSVMSDDDYSPYEAAISQFDANDSIIDECKVTHEDCIKAATTGGQKIQCFIQLGLCVGTKAVGCAKQCVLPLIMCRLSAGGSWEGLMKCATEFLSCTIKGCSKATISDDDYSPYEAAISQFDANDSIIDECKVTHEDCIKAATTGGQKIQCFIQLGLCIGTKAIGCSKQCVLPLIMCRLSAGGSWEGLMKCATEFLSCTYKGCTTENMFDKELSPFEAALAEVDTTNSPIGECKSQHETCMKPAITGSAKIKCFVQLAICVGTKAMGCLQSTTCALKAVYCRISSGGSWDALMKCAQNFIECAIGQCTVVAEDDYSPFEAAIAHYEKNDELVPECKAAHDFCMKTLATGEDKFKCFEALGVCLGQRLLGCSKSCYLSLAWCRLTAGGSWPALFKCAKEFIGCTLKGCFKGIAELDHKSFETAVAYLEKNDAMIAECKAAEQVCKQTLTTGEDPMKCVTSLGICLGKKVMGCAKQCAIPLVLCRITAGGSWPALLKCGKEFLTCTVKGCLTVPQTGHLYISKDVPVFVKVCDDKRKACMSSAKDNIGMIRCSLRYYFCIASKLVDCAQPCLPSLAWCRVKAGNDVKKQQQCIHDLTTCLVGHCKKEENGTSLAVSNDEGIIAQCQIIFNECRAAASGIVQKGECVVQLGLCMAAKLVDCSKDCVAPMLMCKAKAIGNFRELLKCNIDFVKCAVGGCANQTSTKIIGKNDPFERAISLMAKDTDLAMSVDLATCWADHSECAKAAGTEFYPRLYCFMRFGVCIGKELVGCSANCFPQFALCKYNANDDWIKISLCGVKFLWCAKKGCMET